MSRFVGGRRWNRRAAVVAAIGAAAVGLVTVAAPAASVGAIVFVDATATGAGDGTSWADAFVDLHDALGGTASGDEIRVAEGTYRPHADDPAVSFVVGDGVTLAGGYPAGGGSERDPVRHQTVLSGDLAGDDRAGARNRVDNSESIVTVFDNRDEVGISGVIVRGANGTRFTGGGVDTDFARVSITDSIIVDNGGAGVRARYSTVVLDEVVARENTGCGLDLHESLADVRRSEAVANTTGVCSPDATVRLVDSLVADNVGPTGGIRVAGFGRATLVNSVVTGNHSTGHGGGIHNGEIGSLTLVNTLVVANTADGAGGGIYSYGASNAAVVNSVIADNRAPGGGGVVNQVTPEGGAWADVANSIVWGNGPGPAIVDDPDSTRQSTVDFSDVEAWTGTGSGNIQADPGFVGPGDYRLLPSSPAREAGDDAAVPPDEFDVDRDGDVTEPTPDLDGGQRIVGVVDMGAYETPLPAIVPGSVSVVEGDRGTTSAELTVRLSTPSVVPVEATWRTADFTAVAPGDHERAEGSVVFAPGETAVVVPLEVRGDRLDERDEVFVVVFGDPTNATIGGFYGLGFVTVVDDDDPPVARPGLGVVVEGDDAGATIEVPVRLSQPSGREVTLEWVTRDLTARAPGDYVAAGGTLTIEPGASSGTVAVSVVGDDVWEWPEVFLVAFSEPDGVVLGGFRGLGVGLIIDDDRRPRFPRFS